ncbi:MAG: hypothetical protein R3A44_09425 [Caldilineaceae bacterium]
MILRGCKATCIIDNGFGQIAFERCRKGCNPKRPMRIICAKSVRLTRRVGIRFYLDSATCTAVIITQNRWTVIWLVECTGIVPSVGQATSTYDNYAKLIGIFPSFIEQTKVSVAQEICLGAVILAIQDKVCCPVCIRCIGGGNGSLGADKSHGRVKVHRLAGEVWFQGSGGVVVSTGTLIRPRIYARSGGVHTCIGFEPKNKIGLYTARRGALRGGRPRGEEVIVESAYTELLSRLHCPQKRVGERCAECLGSHTGQA